MVNWNRKRRYQRGYPISVLIGFNEARAVIWRIFSRVIKQYKTVEFTGKDIKNQYNFHESIVDALRPVLKEGIHNIVLTGPANTSYTKQFLTHIHRHHLWLVQNNNSTIAFAELVGHAGHLHEVSNLINTPEFRKTLPKVMSEDADRIINTLEKHINEINGCTGIFYSLEEIETLINSTSEYFFKPRYLLLTNTYLSETKEKRRVQRLLQISKNKNVEIKIIPADTKAGNRLSQLGGLVYFTQTH